MAFFQAHLETNHGGLNATRKLISSKFYWNSITNDVETFIKQCPRCRITRQRYVASNNVPWRKRNRCPDVYAVKILFISKVLLLYFLSILIENCSLLMTILKDGIFCIPSFDVSAFMTFFGPGAETSKRKLRKQKVLRIKAQLRSFASTAYCAISKAQFCVLKHALDQLEWMLYGIIGTPGLCSSTVISEKRQSGLRISWQRAFVLTRPLILRVKTEARQATLSMLCKKRPIKIKLVKS